MKFSQEPHNLVWYLWHFLLGKSSIGETLFLPLKQRQFNTGTNMRQTDHTGYCRFDSPRGVKLWRPVGEAVKIADYVYVLELGCNKFEGLVEEFTDLEKAFWV